MISGIWDADASELVLDENQYRGFVEIQVDTIGKDGAWLGFGSPIVASAMMFPAEGSSFLIRGWLARKSIWVSGTGSTGTYNEGFLEVHSQPGL